MYYKAELDYLMRVLGKMRIPARMVTGEEQPDDWADLSLRRFLDLEQEYERTLHIDSRIAKKNIIYKLSDIFQCRYMFLPLLQAPQGEILLVGPYTTREIRREELMEAAERFGIPALRMNRLENYHSSIAIIPDETVLMTLISAFGETVWGVSDAFEIIDVEQELSGSPLLLSNKDESESAEALVLRMKMMEERYAYENELVELVSQGLHHRAEAMLRSVSSVALEQRTADPVRNLRNYCIISNTLMRKAAEKGGVHPMYLDSTSSHFARRIETVTGLETGQALMMDMARTYCRLVRKHSASHYSPPVQRTAAYIEADLAGDLSLHTLAGLQNVSTSYLSTLFHKETGKTLTEYVNEKRMEAAARLLRTTQLQVQTIAQRCGMSDVNYFSKLFKKYSGMTPKQFRAEHHRYRKNETSQ